MKKITSFIFLFLFILMADKNFAAAPTVQASNVSIYSRTSTSMSVSWTRGNGSRVTVSIRSSANALSSPASGYTGGYAGSTTYGQGDNLGNSNYVVYDGTGTSVTITGLTPGTHYYIYAWEYNTVYNSFIQDIYYYYNTSTTSNNDNDYTLCSEPTTGPTSPYSTSVSYTSASVFFTGGSGTYDLVTVDESPFATYYPTDGVSYTANTAWGSGSVTGGDNYVVYISSGSGVAVSNLKSATTYRARIYDYNCTGGLQNYYTAGYTYTDFTTLNYPPTVSAVSSFSVCQDPGQFGVYVGGISDGSSGETQTVSMSATSSNQALIPNANITISYTNPNTYGYVYLTPATGVTGSAVITVTLNDNFSSSNITNTTFTVTVNPKPVMTSASSTSTCSGSTMNFALTSSLASTFNWVTSDNANTTGESTGTQLGSAINNTLTSSLTTATSLIYTVTPKATASGCIGSSQTVTVTVNPKPVMTSANTTSICSASTMNFALTSDAASTYTWVSADNPNTFGEPGSLTHSGSTINSTITSFTTIPTDIVYTVTPTGTAGSCAGSSQTVTVTVNPKPVMSSASSTSVCSGTAMSFSLTSAVPSTFTWLTTDNANTSGESILSQSGSTINNTITSALTSATTLVYTVTPTGTAGACAGAAQSVTVTVYPKPVMSSASSKTVCSGSSVNLALTTTGASSTYQWLAADNVNVSGESVTTQTGSTITNTVTSSSTSIQTLVYTVTPTGTGGSCVGTAQTVTVTLDNLPPVASAGVDSLFCPLSLNLYGNNPFPGTGTWAINSQSTTSFTASIVTPASASSQLNFTNIVSGNSVTLKWTVQSQLHVCPNTVDSLKLTKASCPLTAAFTTSGNSFCIKPGDSAAVVFTDQSVPGTFPPVNSWTWTFNGGTPSSATGMGPHTVYYHYSPTTTVYAASLTVVDNNSNQSTISHNITLNPIPSAAGVISGTSPVCQGTSGVNYSVPIITNANSYSWTFPSGVSSTNPNNNASTNFSNSAQSGVIKVVGLSNVCGAGDTSYFNVTVNPRPDAPGAISGTTPVCQGQSALTFSVSPASNASSYDWIFPSGISTTGTSNVVSVNFGTSAQSGSIRVVGKNLSCGAGDTSAAFIITANPLPSAAGAITGPLSVCQGQQGVSFSVGSLTNADKYIWTLPSGGSTSDTTASISADFTRTASSGTVTVAGINACGTGAGNSMTLTVNPLPAAAGTITGPDSVCQGATGVNYSIVPIAGAGYSWLFPPGGSSVNPNNIALVDFSVLAQSGVIKVAGTNICGAGDTSYFDVTLNPLPSGSGIITGPDSVCQGESGTAFSVSGIVNASSYAWTSPSGSSVNGSTNSVSIDFSAGAQPGNVSVEGVNACGNGGSGSVAITVNPLPDPAGAISGIAAIDICPVPAANSFSVSPINNAADYIWSISNGGVITSGDSSQSVVVDFSSAMNAGTISVSGKNACGTGTASAPLTISFNPAIPADLCIVTVDSASNYNEIYWTRPSTGVIDSFRIYRRVSAVSNVLVGTTAYSDLTYMIDSTSGADPNSNFEEYTITAVDSCGNESDSTLFHRTMFLSPPVYGGSTVTLNWNHYVGQTVNFYRILRDTTGTGTAWDIVDTAVNPNVTVWVDNNLPVTSNSNLLYRVDVIWLTSCDPTRAIINTSRSNIKSQLINVPLGFAQNDISNTISIYPNPAKDLITVEFKKGKNTMVEVYDVTGRIVAGEKPMNTESKVFLNVTDLAGGVYFVKLTSNEGKAMKKIIIEK